MTEGEIQVLERIGDLLQSDNLKAGEKIPSERQLCERLGVKRGHVRKALQRLEYYGILRTLPQRGTIIEKIGGKTLVGIIQAIIQVDEEEDIASIMDTRAVLEQYAARLMAERADAASLETLMGAHKAFYKAAQRGERTLDEDHLFHLSIARACGNNVTLSMISIMTPKIIAMNRDFKERDNKRFMDTYAEHDRIVQAIAAHDPVGAERAMAEHMSLSKLRRLKETG